LTPPHQAYALVLMAASRNVPSRGGTQYHRPKNRPRNLPKNAIENIVEAGILIDSEGLAVFSIKPPLWPN
jgi:hypothetical protein